VFESCTSALPEPFKVRKEAAEIAYPSLPYLDECYTCRHFERALKNKGYFEEGIYLKYKTTSLCNPIPRHGKKLYSYVAMVECCAQRTLFSIYCQQCTVVPS
jgi:hypothetical protein